MSWRGYIGYMWAHSRRAYMKLLVTWLLIGDVVEDKNQAKDDSEVVHLDRATDIIEVPSSCNVLKFTEFEELPTKV
jgi:hypothetical protein